MREKSMEEKREKEPKEMKGTRREERTRSDRRRRRLSPVFERRAFHFATDNVSYRDTSICRHVDKSLILMTNVDNNEKIATL
ncbi:hypothetical protein LSTR_LSTR017026 [Laodelphax striatellus]|uniref:Uncharacterized protein n=1 Tax=Laodelphax striatellus TaxID=195883 RepID=A0A482WPQ0_LAOST|nr:hypothetical protein LSTR_LSTR017026 [Laodelphax striatellus]